MGGFGGIVRAQPVARRPIGTLRIIVTARPRPRRLTVGTLVGRLRRFVSRFVARHEEAAFAAAGDLAGAFSGLGLLALVVLALVRAFLGGLE